MELTKKQLDIIYEQVSSGVLSRNVILAKAIDEDFFLKESYKMCKAGKDEIDIAEKLCISVEKAREQIEILDLLSKTIDSNISKKHMQDFERNRKIIYKDQADKMHVKTKRSLYNKQVKQFLSLYIEAKKEGNLKKMRLEENASKFAAKIEFLSDRVSYKFYLAEMYTYIGQISKARDILSEYEKDQLTKIEKQQYDNIEKEIIAQENKKTIKRMCERGKTYAEIREECERVSTGNRVHLTPQFIKDVIAEYNQEKEDNNKNGMNKTDNIGKIVQKDENEKER